MDSTCSVSHYEALKDRLRAHNYDYTFPIEACPLVERLLSEVVRSVDPAQPLRKSCDKSEIDSSSPNNSCDASGTFELQPSYNCSLLCNSNRMSQASTADSSLLSLKNERLDPEPELLLKTHRSLFQDQNCNDVHKRELDEVREQLNEAREQLADRSNQLEQFIRENRQLIEENQGLKQSHQHMRLNNKLQNSVFPPKCEQPQLCSDNVALSQQVDYEHQVQQLKLKVESLEKSLRCERRKNHCQTEKLRELEVNLQDKDKELHTVQSLRLIERKKARQARSLSPSCTFSRASSALHSRTAPPSFDPNCTLNASSLPSLVSNYISTASPTLSLSSRQSTSQPAERSAPNRSPVKHPLHTPETSAADYPQNHDHLRFPKWQTFPRSSLQANSLPVDHPNYNPKLYQSCFTLPLAQDSMCASMCLQDHVFTDYLNQLRCQNTFYENHIQDLKEQMHSRLKELEKKDELLTVAQCRIDLLSRNVAHLTQELMSKDNSQKKQTTELKQKLRVYEHTVQNMRSFVANAQKDLQVKLDENWRLGEEIRKLKDQIAGHTEQTNILKDSLVRAQVVADAQEQRESNLQKLISQLQRQLESHQCVVDGDSMNLSPQSSCKNRISTSRGEVLHKTDVALLFEHVHENGAGSFGVAHDVRALDMSVQTESTQSEDQRILRKRVEYLEGQLEVMRNKLTQQRSAFNALQLLCTTLKSELARHLNLDFSASNSVTSSMLNSSSTWKNLESLRSSCSTGSCSLVYDDHRLDTSIGNTTLDEDQTASTLLNTSFSMLPSTTGIRKTDKSEGSQDSVDQQHYEYISLLNLNRQRRSKQKEESLAAQRSPHHALDDIGSAASAFSTPQPLYIH